MALSCSRTAAGGTAVTMENGASFSRRFIASRMGTAIPEHPAPPRAAWATIEVACWMNELLDFPYRPLLNFSGE